MGLKGRVEFRDIKIRRPEFGRFCGEMTEPASFEVDGKRKCVWLEKVSNSNAGSCFPERRTP